MENANVPEALDVNNMSKRDNENKNLPVRYREVRKTIALSITTLFVVVVMIQLVLVTIAFFMGKENPNFIVSNQLIEYVIVSVIAYYFGKSTALDNPLKDPNSESVK